MTAGEARATTAALGVALRMMYAHDPALAGRCLDYLVEIGLVQLDVGMSVLDELRELSRQHDERE